MHTQPNTAIWKALVFAISIGGVLLMFGPWKETTRAADTPHFEYSSDAGPAFWSGLSSDWRACSGIGGRQTPIDISPSQTLPTLPVLTPLQLTLRPTEISLLNNGHTLELEAGAGDTLTFNGVVYDLLQVHFHTLSEHTVDGVRYPMEQHAVFKDARTGALAVIGMFYKIGASSAFLANFTELPEKTGQTFESRRTVNVRDSLTATDSYFAYSGSLTTPPCLEIVTWLLLKTPAEMSQEQFARFWRVMGNNFRPTQPRSELMTIFATTR
jgi:carbonic anhydrase